MADRSTKRAARQLAHYFSTVLGRSCYELAAYRLTEGVANGKPKLLQDSHDARKVFADVVREEITMFESAAPGSTP